MNLGTLMASLGVNTASLDAAAAKMKKFTAEADVALMNVQAQLNVASGSFTKFAGKVQASMIRASRVMKVWARSANRYLASVQASLVSFGAGMAKFGRMMTMYVTTSLLIAGGASIKMAAEFEASMSKIVGLVGVAREQVDGWSQDILELAPTVGKGPKELANAMFFVTSAGIRGAEAMDVLEMSAKAATAGLGDTKTVADLVTSAMNAYGVENLSAAEATDILTAAVREGKAEASSLASSMGMVLPVAAEMGVTFDQVGAAVAAMTRTGTGAQTAAMQLRQMLAALLKPAQQAEEALMGMGTSSAELRKTIKEKGLLTALQDVRKLTKVYGEEVMAQVFPNIRALAGVLDLMGKNAEDNAEIFRSLGLAVGSTDIAFEEATNTMQYKWNETLTEGKVLLTEIGLAMRSILIPMLEKVSRKLKSATQWYRSLSTSQKELAIKVAGLVAALGPLLWIVGKLIKAFPLLGKNILKTVGPLSKLLKFVAMNPFAAAGIAVAAIALKFLHMKKQANNAAEAQRALNAELERTQKIGDSMSFMDTFRELGFTKTEEISFKPPPSAAQTTQALPPVDIFGGVQAAPVQATSRAAAEMYKTPSAEVAQNANIFGGDARKDLLGGYKPAKDNQGEIIPVKFEIETIDYSKLEEVSKIIGQMAPTQLRQMENGVKEEIQNITMRLNTLKSYEDLTPVQKKDIEELTPALDSMVTIYKEIVFQTQEAQRVTDKLDEDLNAIDLDKQMTIEIGTAITNLESELAFIDTMAEGNIDGFEEAEAKAQAYGTAIEALARAGAGADSKKLKEYITAFNELAKGDVEAATMTFAESLEHVTKMQKVFGESFDGNSAKLSLYRTELNTMLLTMDVSDEAVIKLKKEMEALTAVVEKSVTPMEGLSEELARIAMMEARLGDSYDDGAAKIAAYTAAYQSLIDQENLSDEDVEAIMNILEALGLLEDGLGSLEVTWQDVVGSILDAAMMMTSALGGLFEAQKERELAAAGGSAKKREEIEKKYAKKQKAVMMAQAAIGTALAIVNASTMMPFIPLGVIAMAAAAAAGAVQIAAIAATPLAEGGLIYGNTFANVGEYPGASSNPEVVSPLNKLTSIMTVAMMSAISRSLPETKPISSYGFPDMGPMVYNDLRNGADMKGKVKFIIEQDKLVGILDNANSDYVNL